METLVHSQRYFTTKQHTVMDRDTISHEPGEFIFLDKAIGDPTSSNFFRLFGFELYVEQAKNNRFPCHPGLDNDW